MASASLRISTLCLGIVILSLFPNSFSLAADEISETTLPAEIEAKAYDLKTVRPSRSGRVYLFEKFETEMPVEGKIFLLREGDTPVMALRVLKTYPSTKRVAAKKLLPYEGFAALAPASQYRAYEKIGDKVAPVPPTPEDLQDLKELESSPTEPLPTEPPPPPGEETPPPSETPPAPVSTDFQDQDADAELKNSEPEDEADEVGSYYPNFFTMAVGLVYNAKVPGPDPKFGGGLLYSRNLGNSFAIEGGFFYYQASGEVNGESISTTVLPLVGSIRYQHRYSELWTGYLYGGLLYPYIMTNVGLTNRQLAQIRVLSPTIGVGVFLQTGPNWYLRLNLGTDHMSVGVTLRY